MRGSYRASLIAAVVLAAACGGTKDTEPVPGHPGADKTTAAARAERRAFDGAPPVIPHEVIAAPCLDCHNERGVDVEGVGFSPPMPHELTRGLSRYSRCEQCHVYRTGDDVMVDTTFVGLAQDLRRGDRLHPLAPPVMPHPTFMRENCLACHAGPAAREAIRTSHPERAHCRQCHAAATTATLFSPGPRTSAQRP